MSSSTSPAESASDEKKFKEKRLPCSSSCVLHLHHLPNDVTAAEIILLGLPFGKVTNLLMLQNKNQALLEMASEEAAISMMKSYTLALPRLQSQPVYVQFSKYKQLQTYHLPHQATIQNILQAMNDMYARRLPLRSAFAAKDTLVPVQGSVLQIIVENLVYPVTFEVLHQIFSKFGTISKIITFNKNNQFHALLQYSDPMNAYYAKMALDGQCIYTGCCILRINFSKLATLNVKYNNDKTRDFAYPDFPSGDGQPFLQSYVPPGLVMAPYAGAAGFAPAMRLSQGGLLVPAVPGPLSSLAVTMSAMPGQMTTLGVPGTSVVLVSHLNPDAITPHGLFILFGVYGDVHRVKIMFKKKETALVQMADATQAQLAITYLNGQKLHGRFLRTAFSKHHTIQLPRDGQEDQGLTKDYSNSPLHRFKKPGSQNFRNIFPPSATLHLSNIPPSVTVDYLKDLFASRGAAVRAFRFLEKHCKTALIQLGSVEEAVEALIDLHSHDLGENRYLQISFSKSTV
ncbi:polypyrimidine tract-binding protein 3 isoform X1 [Colius striatus]|uniref:polypyrimidine tract-binding protein 3 isoform X1 n=1 Tax=Colius striatus TaxID=57412 RepID=UPI002B1E5A5A|nr:polypyrimidine tract-binding protein 3 isoform X1 [Colius striatus]